MAKINKTTNLGIIKNIGTLLELSKFNSLLQRHALALTKGNKYRADEILQNTYINMHNYFERNEGVTINGGLVSVAMRNDLRDLYKKDNRVRPIGSSSELRLKDEVDEIVTENKEIVDIIYKLSDEERQQLLLYAEKSCLQMFKEGISNDPYDIIRQEKKEFINYIKDKYGKN